MERHLQLDTRIQGRSSKISPSMGCMNRGVGAGLREGLWKTVERVKVGDLQRRGNAGRQEGGGEDGDSTHLPRRLSAHSLGCGKLNV